MSDGENKHPDLFDLMTISPKDNKLLWGRAAARCSMPACRRELTEGGAPHGSAVLGEMAHIVADQPTGARGKSPLTQEQRNSYANLILLCPTDHTRIDKPENAAQFPVEVLHQVKVEHEDWVRESLGGEVDPSDLVYARFIAEISLGMNLEAWAWWTDNAVRDLLPFQLVEASEGLRIIERVTLWPEKYPKLDSAARAAIASFVQYVVHFESFSELRGNFLGEDAHYKRMGDNLRFDQYAKKANLWRERNFLLLCDVANRVESFAQSVRECVNPSFFLVAGRFLVHDSMHVRGRGPAFRLEQHAIDAGLSAIGAAWSTMALEYPKAFGMDP